MKSTLYNVLLKLFSLLPENATKRKLRVYGCNFFYKSVKGCYKNGYFLFRLRNGISIKSYYDDISYDLEYILPGYLQNYGLKEGDVVVDCGAYVGGFTLYAAKVVENTGIVITFEPDPLNYEKLINNIKLNNLTNVIAVEKGVWSKNTILKFDNSHSVGSSFLFDEKASSIIDVSVVSLDDELNRNGISKVDFIKMDAEGAEIEIIKGAGEILKSNDVHLAIASYHIVNGEKSCFELEKLLSELGYKVKTSFPKHLTTYATPFLDQ